jgi:small subunit ribosomal protein S21
LTDCFGPGRIHGCPIQGRVRRFPAGVLSPFSRFSQRLSLSEVIIHEDENFERALKRFKKKCEKAGILSDLRKHRHYEKPSERRKRKMNAAVRKNRRTRQG